MRLLFFLATKALLRSRLSLVLLISAVAAGVAFQIPNAANINGYTEELLRQGVSRGSGDLLVVAPDSRPLRKASAIVARLERLPFVRRVTARLIRAGVLLSKDGDYLATRVVGLRLVQEQAAAGFCRQVARGRCPRRSEGNELAIEAAIGDRVAQKIGVDVGDTLKVILPYEEGGEVKFARRRLRVVGKLAGGGGFQSDYDIYLPMDDVGQMLRLRDAATHLGVFLDDRSRASERLPAVAAASRPARVEPWWQTTPSSRTPSREIARCL